MKKIPSDKKSMLTLLLTGLLLLSFIQTSSAQVDIISGSGTISGGPLSFSPTLTLTFPPKGGDVNGTVSGSQPFNNGAETCTQSFSGTVTGTFAGGDNGTASGSMNMTFQVVCSGGSNTQSYSGTWQGTLGAGGSGGGTWTSVYGGGAWQITYSASEFQNIIAPRVYDYLYFWDTYGINLQDGDKEWEQRDMKLLDEVRSNLPEEFLDKLRAKVFRRYEYDWDENWNSTETFGKYYWNGNRQRSGELMMFDAAYYKDFYGDQSGETSYKAVLVHEMMHSLQESYGSGTIANRYNNPVVDQFYHQNCWIWSYQNMVWKRDPNCSEDLPWREGEEKPGYLPYSSTDPLEDMSVSAESYVYSPDLLKSKNPGRYEFMKNNVFGGVEYENGIPK